MHPFGKISRTLKALHVTRRSSKTCGAVSEKVSAFVALGNSFSVNKSYLHRTHIDWRAARHCFSFGVSGKQRETSESLSAIKPSLDANKTPAIYVSLFSISDLRTVGSD